MLHLKFLIIWLKHGHGTFLRISFMIYIKFLESCSIHRLITPSVPDCNKSFSFCNKLNLINFDQIYKKNILTYIQ